MIIDNEMLAAYAEGNVSEEERRAVRQYLEENPDMMEAVCFAMNESVGENEFGCDKYLENLGNMVDKIEDANKRHTVNHTLDSKRNILKLEPSFLPMSAMAAQNTADNLCVIRCEGIALRHFGIDITDKELQDEARQQGWLQPQGIALHNIGRLSGTRGLSVSHRYQCSLEDIRASLSASNIVIAAVDENELVGDYFTEQDKDTERAMTPNHVVIVNIITEDSVIITDSATPEQMNVYSLPQFLDAWDNSENYLTIISNSNEYTPHPIKLDDVTVEEELKELQEAIAENAHEVWAETRINEGWSYGPFRNDEQKLHPDIIPYNLLTESEKEYDRLMAINTIKLVKKLGWELTKRDTPTKKPRRPRTGITQASYTEIELRAITTLFLELLCVDARILPAELIARGRIYQQFGITYQYEQNLLSLDKARQIFKSMTEEKRDSVQRALVELALADGDINARERQYLEDLK